MSNALSAPWPDIAIPPGETLADLLAARGLTQAALARRMGRPAQAVNEIIRGTKSIEPETAFQLERVLGVPAHFWLNLERDYRYNKARLSDLERLGEEAQHSNEFPYSEMARLGWVPKTRDPLQKVRNLLSFFEAGSLRAALNVYATTQHRVSRTRKPSKAALAAWLREGERQAERIETAPYNVNALTSHLGEVRGMTCRRPEQFCDQLRDLLASCGVALVFVPHLPKSYAHGATRWLAPDKALVQVSLRGSYADIFWFTLFHELGHILRHGKRHVFVEIDDGVKTDEEREADEFAADTLVPPEAYRKLTGGAPFSVDQVRQFALEVGVAPGVVVGRLQHDGRLPHSHLHDLRERYAFSTSTCGTR